MNTNIIEEVLAIYDNTHENEDDYDQYKIVEDGDWVSEYKYEYHTLIVSYKGKYYQINESRTGSYFTDYDYSEPEAFEVIPEKRMVEVTDWKVVQ